MRKIYAGKASNDIINIGKYLSFKLGEEMYVASVTKIKKVELEVRIMPDTKTAPKICTIIIDAETDDGTYTNGVLIDEVCKVVNAAEHVQTGYDVRSNTRIIRGFVSGVGEVDGREISIVNPPQKMEVAPDLFSVEYA